MNSTNTRQDRMKAVWSVEQKEEGEGKKREKEPVAVKRFTVA